MLICNTELVLHNLQNYYSNYPLYVIGQAGNLHYEAEDLRQQCVSFLQYIKVFLYR